MSFAAEREINSVKEIVSMNAEVDRIFIGKLIVSLENTRNDKSIKNLLSAIKFNSSFTCIKICKKLFNTS